jgi:hypothetical protein
MSYALTAATTNHLNAPESLGETSNSRAVRWVGTGATAMAVAFLAFDAAMKVLQVAPAVEGTAQLGYPAGVLLPLGLIQVACLALYLTPRTAVLGAVLWTGYLGGAIATHVRVESPLLTHTLFPIYVAALLWAGLWVRDARVRRLLQRR